MLTYDELPEVLTPQLLMKYLPIGRNAIYEALKAKVIRSVRVGQRYLIPKDALREFLGLSDKSLGAGAPTEETIVWGT